MIKKISVITPCYNAKDFILKCLESVAQQAPFISKHIIADGGSNDGTVDILNEYARKNSHVIWYSKKDRGQADALNSALTFVDSEYFGWLNADDCYLPSTLGVLLNESSKGDFSIIYGDYQVIDAYDRVIKFRRQPSFRLWDCIHGYLTVQNCAAIFQTKVARLIGGFDSSLQFAMDYDFIIKLAKQGNVRYVRHYIGQFRSHARSKTSKMQNVCLAETKLIRSRYSEGNLGGQQLRLSLAKTRVAVRMIFEGCVWSRLGVDRADRRISLTLSKRHKV